MEWVQELVDGVGSELIEDYIMDNKIENSKNHID